MGNLSSAAAADPASTQVDNRAASLAAARETTLRLYLADRAEPVEERMRADRAEDAFHRTQDAALWPNVVSAELVGDDDDVMDRW